MSSAQKLSWWEGLKIGSPMGIPLILDSTFLLVLLWHVGYILWNGTSLVSLLQWLGVFAIVTCHEYGHSYAARNFGIATTHVKLYPFGGIASLERLPSDPKQMIIVALAGPFVNVVLAVLAFGLNVAALRLQWPTYMVETAEWLLLVNVVICAFNMLPAYPMDGGRVFSSILSMVMPKAKAMNITVWAARAIFGGMILFGAMSGQYVYIFLGCILWFLGHAELKTLQKAA